MRPVRARGVAGVALLAAAAWALTPALAVAAPPAGLASPPSGAGPSPRAATSSPPAPTAPSPAPTPPGRPGEPWWVPLALRGTAVTAVTASGGRLVAVTAGGAYASDDGGRTLHRSAAPVVVTGSAAPPPRGGCWAVRQGRAANAPDCRTFRPDPRSPDLGAGSRLLAAPVAMPGDVVAVDGSGVVWRRDPAGDWGRVLVLQPAGLLGGIPRITSIAAFDEPLTAAVYLGTDGYATLLSDDGGASWLRGGPGLPDRVLALSADSTAQAVYAGTADGLWVHRLRALPGVPSYGGSDLTSRRIALVLITAAALAAAVAGLAVALRAGAARS